MSDNQKKHPYATAPKNGRLIGLGSRQSGGPWPMRWDAARTNATGDVVGVWVMDTCDIIWIDRDPADAPEWWVEQEETK